MPEVRGDAINSLAAGLGQLAPGHNVMVGRGQSARLAELVMRAMPASAEPAGDADVPGILLIVSDGFRHRPWRSLIIDGLAGTNFQVAVHSGLPTPHSVLRIADQIRRQRPAALVAIGGGSVMDAAKSAAVLARLRSPGVTDVRRLCSDGATERLVPVIAVPTTPGTGAEATPFATIWDTDASRKLSLRGPSMLPASVLLDPDLLAGLPASQLASCVLDSFAQGIEANWSTGSDAAVERLSRTALGYLARFLDRAPDSGDEADRSCLQLAGHLSGRAIATAGTTLCHALSYPITLRYGVAHGHACGLTLSRVLRYNAAVDSQDCADPRGPERVRQAISASVAAAGAAAEPDLARKIDRFVAAHSPTVNLRAEADAIASQALTYDRAGNNPRRVDRHTLAQLLAS